MFFKNHAGYEADPFLFFKKALYKVKASGLQLSFDIFRYLAYNKDKLIKLKIINPEMCLILIFSLHLILCMILPHFVYEGLLVEFGKILKILEKII